MALSDYCRRGPGTLCSGPQYANSRAFRTGSETHMKPHMKVLLLAALVLPGGVFLLLVPPAKMLWRYGAERMSRKPA